MIRPAQRPFKIVLIDDHVAVRFGVTELLAKEADFEVVAAFATSGELLDDTKNTAIDILIVDYHLAAGDMDGLNLIRTLRQRFPDTKILVFSGQNNLAAVSLIMKAGAHGFIGKDQALQELVGAARTLALGRTYLPPNLSMELLELNKGHWMPNDARRPVAFSAIDERRSAHNNKLRHYRHNSVLLSDAALSNREREVLSYYLRGHSVTDIAQRLDRSVKTVSTQKRSAFRKLGIRTDSELFTLHAQSKIR